MPIINTHFPGLEAFSTVSKQVLTGNHINLLFPFACVRIGSESRKLAIFLGLLTFVAREKIREQVFWGAAPGQCQIPGVIQNVYMRRTYYFFLRDNLDFLRDMKVHSRSECTLIIKNNFRFLQPILLYLVSFYCNSASKSGSSGGANSPRSYYGRYASAIISVARLCVTKIHEEHV